MVLKQIKITESVKNELDSLKHEKETYNLVIQRLIKENAELKADKEKLFKIALANANSNEQHSFFYFFEVPVIPFTTGKIFFGL